MKETRAIAARLLDPKGVSDMSLAPDGKHAVAIAWTGQANALLLIDTDTGNSSVLVKPEVRSGWRGAVIQPRRARWISNDSLAVDFNDGDCVAMGFDGRRGRVLGKHFVRMISSLDGVPTPWAIVGADGWFGNQTIHRVNVNTGESVDVPIGLPGHLMHAVFDRGGHLRAATTGETHWFEPGAKITNWYRHDENSPWQQLAQAPATQDLWVPFGVPDASDTLVVLSREGRDTLAMFTYDVATRRMTDMLAGHPTEDLVNASEDDHEELIRVMTNGLKPTTYWFDATWDRLQRTVDAKLPDAVNVLHGNPHGMVLVFSASDRDPGRWLVLDTQRKTLREVAQRHVSLAPADMLPMQTLTYASDDGTSIPAYLTLPKGPPKPGPMVVFIHGGPVARDQWAWNHDTQLLAAAGYAVFQPQFRGSSGFGRKFEQAGYRQWGLKMQDDVTAGVTAMIARGVADPQRICIYGASYGGYAALWGLVKTPELYRCGVSLAGVSDIGQLFSDRSDTNASTVGPEFMRFRIGDIDTMGTQFDAVSPARHADRIKVPVLLAHGTRDVRVPIGHSKRMAAAIKEAHGSVETHWYDGEGHGLGQPEHIQDFDAALLDFLDRHIGPASPGAATVAAPVAEASAAKTGQP